MPPRKRKTGGTEGAPESKRWVTRSASKAKATAAKEAVEPRTKSAAAQPSRSSKTPEAPGSPKEIEESKKTARSETPSIKGDDSQTAASCDEANGPTSLTITHDSLKNPITCHQWTWQLSPRYPLTTLIFTHGAGGSLTAPAVVNFCTGYSIYGNILAFQGSMNLAARVKGFHACISHLQPDEGDLVLGGRSMGARAAVMAGIEALVADRKKRPRRVLKLVLVSYPLKGPKGDIRDKILLDLPRNAEVVFFIGERDAMCPLELLQEVRMKMAATSKLMMVRDADHGMHVNSAADERWLGEEAGKNAAKWVDTELYDRNHDDVVIGRNRHFHRTVPRTRHPLHRRP